MSIRERLQNVTSEAELYDVIHDMRIFGSPNWTADAVRRFVPTRFVPSLRHYFDADGDHVRVLPQRPSSAQGVAGMEPGRTGQAEGGLEAVASTAESLYAAIPQSLTQLIEAFHQQLADLSSGPSVETGVDQSWETPISDFVLEEALPLASAFEEDLLSVHSSASEDAEAASVPENSFFCLICNEWVEGEPVVFRSRSMCSPCARLLRVS